MNILEFAQLIYAYRFVLLTIGVTMAITAILSITWKTGTAPDEKLHSMRGWLVVTGLLIAAIAGAVYLGSLV